MSRPLWFATLVVSALVAGGCGDNTAQSSETAAPPSDTAAPPTDTAALPADACALIPADALAAAFPAGVPAGEETAPSLCEFASSEVGGPKVTIAAITPEQVHTAIDVQRNSGTQPVTDVTGLADEASLIDGVRIFKSADDFTGGAGTGGATLGIVAGDVGLWITVTRGIEIEPLGRAAVAALA